MGNSTGICVVLYYTEKFRLVELREELQILKSRVVIVDNTPNVNNSNIFKIFENIK